jgi:hypothetical protein
MKLWLQIWDLPWWRQWTEYRNRLLFRKLCSNKLNFTWYVFPQTIILYVLSPCKPTKNYLLCLFVFYLLFIKIIFTYADFFSIGWFPKRGYIHYSRSYYRKESVASSPRDQTQGSMRNLLNKGLFIWSRVATTRYEAWWFRYIEISHDAWFSKKLHFLEMDYS